MTDEVSVGNVSYPFKWKSPSLVALVLPLSKGVGGGGA